MDKLEAKNTPSSRKPHRDIDKLIENVVGLMETYIKMAQLEVKSGVSEGITLVIILTFLVAFLSSSLLFLSIGIAFLLNHLFEWHTHVGFLIIAGAYFVFFILVYLVRGRVKGQVTRSITNLINK